MQRLLVFGATGFIGQNILEFFRQKKQYEIVTVSHTRAIECPGVKSLQLDLRNDEAVRSLLQPGDIVIQAAAVTSGANDIVRAPSKHVTDNAVMNSIIFRAAHECQVKQLVFFSCSVMYPHLDKPVKEEDFNGDIFSTYFGVGWTKVYLEKMAEFFSRLNSTRFTVIRHSNIFGPYDKYRQPDSHVFAATVDKVMGPIDPIVIWGNGEEKRDLLYVEDLCEFVELALERQESFFQLVNVGSGKSISVTDLVTSIMRISEVNKQIEFDSSKPTIPWSVSLDCTKAFERFGWTPKTTLEEGIRRTLSWYKEHVQN